MVPMRVIKLVEALLEPGGKNNDSRRLGLRFLLLILLLIEEGRVRVRLRVRVSQNRGSSNSGGFP